MFDLKGKKALVTGASRGIGKGIALCLAEAGADVVVNYRSKAKEAEGVVKEIKEMGREAMSIQADVSQKTQVEKMIQAVIQKLGQIDILVNNAGVLGAAPFTEMTEEEWNRVLDVNLNGYFLVAQAVIKEMIKQGRGGRVVNISSIASGQIGVGAPMSSHYATTKGGVIALTESLAPELASHKINVNAIAPGIIETDMVNSFLQDEKTAKGYLARIPKGRWGRPKDIGYAAVYLASDEADYVTGTVLYVEGGWLST